MIWHKFDPEDEKTWPPFSKDVLVVRKVWNGRVIRRGYLSANYKKAFLIEGNIINSEYVTHWATMPELPPEGDESREDLIRQLRKSEEIIGRKNGKYIPSVLVTGPALFPTLKEMMDAGQLPGVRKLYSYPECPEGAVYMVEDNPMFLPALL